MECIVLLDSLDKINHLGEIININIYRIVQEAMNNCFKHANAKNIIISLNQTKKNLKFNFTDDGIGFDTKLLNKTKQFGLIGMQERVKALNGNIAIKSVKREGTSINISIPLDI
jgi:signal transduction histidine kinase